MTLNVLFVTWDGPQVNYLQGLFLPIFQRLTESGYRFHVLQFTWGTEAQRAEPAAACAAAGIPYRAVKVWRRPASVGQFATAVFGAVKLSKAARDWNIDILMPRSLMPALATLCLRNRKGLRVLFDADGLPADERVDFARLSASGLTYRLLRDIEAQMVRSADHVITRSQAASLALLHRAGAGTNSSKFTVVSNGRDPESFPFVPNASPADAALRLVYAGSVGPQYHPEKMIEVAQTLRSRFPQLEFHVLTGNPDNFLKALTQAGVRKREWIVIKQLSPGEVGPYLARCHLGLGFRSATYSSQALAPIKLGEYLLAGLPVIGTAEVGDARRLVEEGVMLPDGAFDGDQLAAWVRRVCFEDAPAVRATCRALGEKLFSIDSSVRQYQSALKAAHDAG